MRRFWRPTLIRILDCIYADDTALVSNCFEDIQEIDQLAQTAIKFGLLISLQKTMSMRFNPAVQENLTVPTTPWKMSPPFHTLAASLHQNNDMEEEFNMRIGRARGVFFKLKVMESVWYPEGYQDQTLQCCGVIHFTVRCWNMD